MSKANHKNPKENNQFSKGYRGPKNLDKPPAKDAVADTEKRKINN